MESVSKELHALANPEKAKLLARFFKTGKGEYAEADVFLGVTVPQTRKVVDKNWKTATLIETTRLLHSKIHEERLAALLIMVKKFEKGNESERKEIYGIYLSNTKWINNWDLVDSSAGHIIGRYLLSGDWRILKKLAKSSELWERRIAIIATFAFIYQKQARPTLEIAEMLVEDRHDLIHKAVGWMLREVGKRVNEKALEAFLDRHAEKMPRTMLRYAIERMPANKRKAYLSKGSKSNQAS